MDDATQHSGEQESSSMDAVEPTGTIAPKETGASTAGKVVTGFLWRFAERVSEQLVQFVVSIVLARIIEPREFGVISLVLVFTQVLQVFVDSGVATALIQKKDADNVDFSSVFYFNLVWCSLVYAAAFFGAPAIADFYGKPELTAITRVLALTVIISGPRNVQQAYVSRTMQFRRFFWATLSGTVVSGIVGIAMAKTGYGVWALVMQQVLNVGVATLVLWFTVRWRPTLDFSFPRLLALVSFGWRLLAAGLIDVIYNNVRQLLIGKLYTETDLAFFNRGQQLPMLVVINVNTSLDSVLLPVMSQAQDDLDRVRSMCRTSISVNTFVIAPLMMGMAFCGEPLVSLVFTDKWLPMVPYLQIFCVAYVFSPLQTITVDAVKALGESGLYLKLEVVKKAVGVALLLSTMRMGVMALAYSLLASYLVTQVVNMWASRRILEYRYLDQLKDILPGILLAVAMGCAVRPLAMLPLHTAVVLALQLFLGAGIYLGGSALLGLKAFDHTKQMALSLLAKTRRA